MAAKWHTVEGATIVADKKQTEQEAAQTAVLTAYQAWQRKHDSEPEAVFMADPFAETWNGLPVIEEGEFAAGAVYVGVTG